MKTKEQSESLAQQISHNKSLPQQISPTASIRCLTLFFFFIRHTNQTLADEVGIDVTRHVVNNLVGAQPKYLGVRMEGADLAMLDAFVEKGLIGKKATKGFFDYSDPKAKSRSVTKEASEIIAKFSDPKKSAKGLKPEEEGLGKGPPFLSF